jgi:DUF1009 family protein
MEPQGNPLAILAAGGRIPLQVAQSARAAGRDVFILGFEGEIDVDFGAFPHEIVKWGQLGRMEKLLADRNIRDLVLIGAIDKRPDIKNMKLDLRALRVLPRLMKTVIGGDDSVLTGLIAFMEESGFCVLGAHEVAPELVAAPGVLVGPADTRIDGDGEIAYRAAGAIGALDIGQGAIALDGRVVALEAAEGTDGMIARVGQLRQSGRLRWSGRKGVLAKRSKPQQDLRVDMPAIGPRTVEAIADAGLAGIVIEAGRVMIAERELTIEAAKRSRTYIFAAPASSASP